MPKHIEIERKFLIEGDIKEVLKYAEQQILVRQGYFGTDKYEIRIRQEDWLTSGGSSYFLTHKSGIGISRVENEMQITREMYDTMFPLCRDKNLTKFRYLCMIPGTSLIWEIDVFLSLGKPLILAEIELEHEDMEYHIPDILKPFIVREVTGEAEFTNSNIAKKVK